MVVEGHVLPCQPSCVDVEHRGQKMFNFWPGLGLAVHILADMASPQFDAMGVCGFDEVALPYVAQVHRLVEALRESIGHYRSPLVCSMQQQW